MSAAGPKGPGGGQPAGGPGKPGAVPTPMRPHGPAGGGPGARMMMGGGPVEKPLDFRASLRRMAKLVSPDRAVVGVIVLLAIGSVALSATAPRLLGHATDIIVRGVFGQQLAGTTKDAAIADLERRGEDDLASVLRAEDVTPGQGIDFDALMQVLLIVAAIYVVSWALGVLQSRLTATLVQRTVFRLREELATKITCLPLKYFDGLPRGEVLSRVTNDTDNLAQSLQQSLSQLLTSILTIVAVLAMMLWLSPLLALIAIVSVPLSVWVTAKVAVRSQPKFIEQWRTTGTLNGHIEEAITGHDVVRVFGRQQEAIDTFDTHNERLFGSSYRAQFLSGLIQPAVSFIGNVNYVLVAVVGGLRVASGALSVGDVQAFIQYSRQFSQPLTQVASMSNLLQSGLASAERIFQLLDEDEQPPEPKDPPHPDPVRGRVVFDDVSFRYAPDQPLIEHLSLEVEPGQTVAIVGPSGAGKTTLVNLLMRFYDLTSGRILIDGVDIAAMSRDDVRELTGMVLQEPWLFDGSIEDNLAYGADEPTHDEVVAAADAARADHFIRTLPDGYATTINDDTGQVSAGEKQLLTIARAFLAEPSILILDEATSSVDTRTEVLIQQAMNELRAGRTSFVIAHRLSTISGADVILVMERGSIVEQGRHEELIAAGGPYARLYEAQFAAAPADEA